MIYQDYVPDFTVTTDSNTGVRYYEIGGEKFPSVTTVLGHGTKGVIRKWQERVGHDKAAKITRQAGLVGNALHDACEKYMLVRGTDDEAILLKQLRKNPFHYKQFKKVKTILDERVDHVYLSETFLYSSGIGLAGRCDLVARYNGKKTMIDFKTSGSDLIPAKVKKYKLQGLAYILMHNEIFTDEEPIEDFVVISAPGTSPYAITLPFEGISFDATYISDLHDNVAEFNHFLATCDALGIEPEQSGY
jgi:hypothetical protein